MGLKRFLYLRLFTPKQKLKEAADELQGRLGITSKHFVGVHIRRGDKISEAKPVAVDKYARAVVKLCKGGSTATVFVASDDVKAHEQLQKELGPTFTVVRQPPLPQKYYQM